MSPSPQFSFSVLPPLAKLGMSALVVTSALALPLCAQAQSAYVMTSLKTTTFQQALWPDAALFLDAQNRVYGCSPFYQGFSFNTGGLMLLTVPVYKPFIVQWAVPTFGTSVSSTKVSNTSACMDQVSTNGNQFIASMDAYPYQVVKVLDRASGAFKTPSAVDEGGQITPYLANLQLVDVNNAGRVIGNYSAPLPQYVNADHAAAYHRAFSWVPGQNAVALSVGVEFVGASVSAISESGVIVGAVHGSESAMNTHAARWTNSMLEVLDSQSDRGSMALAVNDAGQVLIRRWELKVLNTPNLDYQLVEQINPTYGVVQNGTLTPIVSSVPGYKVQEALTINASGVVIGTLAPQDEAAPPPGTRNFAGSLNQSRRAFLWKNGTMSDLTAQATAKGVKLPSGVLLNKGIAINDQGSVVAGYVNPRGGEKVFVRLLAKP